MNTPRTMKILTDELNFARIDLEEQLCWWSKLINQLYFLQKLGTPNLDQRNVQKTNNPEFRVKLRVSLLEVEAKHGPSINKAMDACF